jgi:hypothetical protein
VHAAASATSGADGPEVEASGPLSSETAELEEPRVAVAVAPGEVVDTVSVALEGVLLDDWVVVVESAVVVFGVVCVRPLGEGVVAEEGYGRRSHFSAFKAYSRAS